MLDLAVHVRQRHQRLVFIVERCMFYELYVTPLKSQSTAHFITYLFANEQSILNNSAQELTACWDQ